MQMSVREMVTQANNGIKLQKNNHKNSKVARRWWSTPLIPALGRQRQEDLCEFEVSLVYKARCRTARANQ